MGDNGFTVAAAALGMLGTIALGVLNLIQSRRASKQLHPNSGSTVADAVRRIEHTVNTRLDRQSEDIAGLREDYDGLRERFDMHVDGRPPRRRPNRKDTT